MGAEAPEVPIDGHGTMIQVIGDGVGAEWIGRMLRATEGATAGTEVVAPDHGKTGGWEIVDQNLDYLRTLHGGVAELYDAGISDFEMKPVIEERLGAFSDWAGFDSELGKHISLAYLEVEADAF